MYFTPHHRLTSCTNNAHTSCTLGVEGSKDKISCVAADSLAGLCTAQLEFVPNRLLQSLLVVGPNTRLLPFPSLPLPQPCLVTLRRGYMLQLTRQLPHSFEVELRTKGSGRSKPSAGTSKSQGFTLYGLCKHSITSTSTPTSRPPPTFHDTNAGMSVASLPTNDASLSASAVL